ncbi:3-deoxy-7-phosphoheptulonate synthase [Streptomyces sp. NPDC005438]|uniref:3-deoxy-7-phosphoheptulonate synthase n=1 Tax=Streptomyces sp. NPDC005438 TaxID=3156880 RepID=UPI0033AF1330
MTDIEAWREPTSPTTEPEPRGPDGPDDDLARLRTLPPLVFAGECDELRQRLARVARGEGFVLQGGLRARTYGRDTADVIRDALCTVTQMSVLLTYAASAPVVKLSQVSHTDGLSSPLPRYQTSATVLNLVRAFTAGGYAGLAQVHAWNSEFVEGCASRARYGALMRHVGRALDFMGAYGFDLEGSAQAEFYASHETGSLPYETALTRVDSRSGRSYNTDSHHVWVDCGPRGMDAATLEYVAGLHNPLGVVLGPDSAPEEVLAPLERLDPGREAGRLTLVARMGVEALRHALPAVVEKVNAEGHQVVWVCDPIHPVTARAANGTSPGSGDFDRVRTEVGVFFEVLRELGAHPGGLHVQLAGPEPAEGEGAASPPSPVPHLGRAQALELAFQVAETYCGPEEGGPASL